MEDKIRALHTEQEVAIFRADLATSSPQSYTLEEKKQIVDDLDAATTALDDAIRADFNSLPKDAQIKMLEMLKASDTNKDGFWERLLL